MAIKLLVKSFATCISAEEDKLIDYTSRDEGRPPPTIQYSYEVAVSVDILAVKI